MRFLPMKEPCQSKCLCHGQPQLFSPEGKLYIPREITFRSTHQSPRTVNKKAKEFVIGTVKLNSVSIISIRYPPIRMLPGAVPFSAPTSAQAYSPILSAAAAPTRSPHYAIKPITNEQKTLNQVSRTKEGMKISKSCLTSFSNQQEEPY